MTPQIVLVLVGCAAVVGGMLAYQWLEVRRHRRQWEQHQRDLALANHVRDVRYGGKHEA